MAMEDRRFYISIMELIRTVSPAPLCRLQGRPHRARAARRSPSRWSKSCCFPRTATFSRKLQEIGGAFVLENKLSKDEISDLYLTVSISARAAYGVRGAAKVYFGKSARQSRFPEAAMLGALTRAPFGLLAKARSAFSAMRAGRVLDCHGGKRAITQAQADKPRAHPATSSIPTENWRATISSTRPAMRSKHRSLRGRWICTSRRDGSRLQEMRAHEHRYGLNRPASRKRPRDSSALVFHDDRGAVRALIGGKDYAESAFNRITKPIVSLAPPSSRSCIWQPSRWGSRRRTTRVDEPTTIKDRSKAWTPENYRI
jgi:penicillin-binding protein 1A